MGRKAKAAKERAPLPPLPDLEDGPLAGAGWMTAMQMLARDGDERAAAAIRASLRSRPDLWQTTGGGSGAIAREAEDGLIDLFGSDPVRNAYERTRLRADLDRLRAALLDGSTDPLDELMVARILACHLAVCHAEALVGQGARDGATMRTMQFYYQGVDRANTRFNRACESFARVRRLRGPAVAVSIGSVNVGTSGAAVPAPDAPAMLPEADAIEAGWRAADPSAVPVPAPVPERDR